jgi:hypothetical protein
MILFKSRLYREEILRWLLMGALFFWAVTSTVWGFSRSEKLVLIAMTEHGARLVSASDDESLREESLKFLKAFVVLYLNYEPATYDANVGQAADLMSSDLWGRLKEHLLGVSQKMKAQPLSQSAVIETIDAISQTEFEVIVTLKVRQKLEESKGTLKLRISLREKPRTEGNPWRFEIVELKDELL